MTSLRAAALAAFQQRTADDAEELRCAEMQLERERGAERRRNAIRAAEKLATVLGVPVDPETVTGFAQGDDDVFGHAAVTIDGIRLGVGHTEDASEGDRQRVFVLTDCTRAGCMHRDWPVALPVRSLADVGAALAAIADCGAEHSTARGNDCRLEDWGA